MHGLKGLPNVLDIRTVGPRRQRSTSHPAPTRSARGHSRRWTAVSTRDLMMRITGDTIALSPPLIVTEDQIGEITDKLAKVIRAVA